MILCNIMLYPLRWVTLTALFGQCLGTKKTLHFDSFGTEGRLIWDELTPEFVHIQDRESKDTVATKMQDTYGIMVCSTEKQLPQLPSVDVTVSSVTILHFDMMISGDMITLGVGKGVVLISLHCSHCSSSSCFASNEEEKEDKRNFQPTSGETPPNTRNARSQNTRNARSQTKKKQQKEHQKKTDPKETTQKTLSSPPPLLP